MLYTHTKVESYIEKPGFMNGQGTAGGANYYLQDVTRNVRVQFAGTAKGSELPGVGTAEVGETPVIKFVLHHTFYFVLLPPTIYRYIATGRVRFQRISSFDAMNFETSLL
jgi:hypothetical protein